MTSTHLNEHDANQGAQSSGEFLGMTGNSGWYLLGSGGATILMVILLWGILGMSLLLCLLVGIVLCVLSVAYVFTLKNNKPGHYDTDFFEAALVEAGVLQFSFGPRFQRPVNVFADSRTEESPAPAAEKQRSLRQTASASRNRSCGSGSTPAMVESVEPEAKTARAGAAPIVTQAAYEQLQEKLTTTEEMLEEALAEAGED
jgi:hypothetical protein